MMLPMTAEQALAFLMEEFQRERQEKSWVVTALRLRMEECPCTNETCQRCIADAALLAQVRP